MSWSLALQNGDLALGSGGLNTVTGAIKLAQDLRCALLERRGHDYLHPDYGSLIDGGIDENGREVSSLIGEVDWSWVASRVESEILRISNLHQKSQLARAQSDRSIYGRSTLDPSELLLQIQSVDISQTQDAMMVNISIVTGENRNLTINIPLVS